MHDFHVGDLVELTVQRGARRARVRLPVVAISRRRIRVRIGEQRVWVNPARVARPHAAAASRSAR